MKLIQKIFFLVRQIQNSWLELWRYIEGPELEPRIWHSHFLSHYMTKAHLRRFGKKLQGIVIDVGAGTGHGEEYLDKNQSTYYPTDLPTGRNALDSHITKKGTAPVHHCSVYDLPFDDENFGGGMMLMVLEHLQWPEKGLREFSRVIKPGGYALITTPFAFPVHDEPHDYRRWTANGIKSELENAGLVTEECVVCGALFSSLILNLHLGLRYKIFYEGPLLVRKILVICMPLIIIVQGILNAAAIVLDKLDRKSVLPIAIVTLAKKPLQAKRKN